MFIFSSLVFWLKLFRVKKYISKLDIDLILLLRAFLLVKHGLEITIVKKCKKIPSNILRGGQYIKVGSLRHCSKPTKKPMRAASVIDLNQI